MWIFNMDGFFSVVEYRPNPNKVLIRARYLEDITVVARKLECRVWHTPKGDYPYRIFCSKKQWALYLARSARAINYDNFKNAALKNVGVNRVSQYHNVWSAMGGCDYFIPKGFGEEDSYEEKASLLDMQEDDPEE